MTNNMGTTQVTMESMNQAYYAVMSDFSVLGKNINSQNMQIAKEASAEKVLEAENQKNEKDNLERVASEYLDTVEKMQKERMDKIMNIDGYQVTSEALSEVAGERLKTLDDDAKERGWSDDEKVDMAGYLLILENGTPEEQQEAIEAMKKIDPEYVDDYLKDTEFEIKKEAALKAGVPEDNIGDFLKEVNELDFVSDVMNSKDSATTSDFSTLQKNDSVANFSLG